MNYPTFRRGPPSQPRLVVEREKKRDPELNSKWSRFASSYLRRHPFCAECQRRDGMDVMAVLVDHIVPRKHEGAMWDKKNLQGLCRQCDLGVKRQLERLALELGDVRILINWMEDPATRPAGHSYTAVAIEE